MFAVSEDLSLGHEICEMLLRAYSPHVIKHSAEKSKTKISAKSVTA